MKNKSEQLKQVANDIIYQSLIEWEGRHADAINQTTQKIVNSLIEAYRKKVNKAARTI